MKSPLTLIKNNSFVASILRDFTSPVSANLIRAFQIYFAFHIFICALAYYLINPGEKQTILGLAILFAASVATFFRRYCRLGLLILLIYQIWWVIIGNFPMTANHHFLEGYVLLFLVLFPSRVVNRSKNLVDGASCHLIQFAVLYAYFFSVFHKILHGFWLNGELLGWSMFSFKDLGSPIYYSGQLILKTIANLFNLPISNIPFDRSLEMGQAALSIPIWLIITLVVIHWFTILGELTAPILVILYRNQKLGRYLLMGMSLVIGLPSLELQFAFAVLGCNLLFFPKRPVRNYAILMLFQILIAVASLGFVFARGLA